MRDEAANPANSGIRDAKSATPSGSGSPGDGTKPPASGQRIPGPFYLFVYGTLTSPSVFRAVIGKRLVFDPHAADGVSAYLGREAVLPGYEKVSPDNTYLYAVPHPQGRIRGYVIGPLAGECMESLERYEGRNYTRLEVEVRTPTEVVKAFAFVADMEQIGHTFGYEFRDHLKQEVLLHNKIDALLAEMLRAQGRPDSDTDRRALAELHGSTIRDLVRQHFESGGISNFYIRQSLAEEPVRDYKRALDKRVPREMMVAYLAMVIRQVLFNQIEERLREEFRYELDRMRVGDRFYERTISALATLRLLNDNARLLDLLVGDALTEVPLEQSHLIDYVRWAIATADAFYDSVEAARHLRYIRTHMGRGFIPMGAEVEFSNIGHAVISPDRGADKTVDAVYDGFQYFSDFALDILMWKLGGHVDDHREKVSDKPKRGFLEFAFGNLSIAANLSKPITDDPWLLNQMIQETIRFYPVKPHSVHLSLQLPHDRVPDMDATLPLSVMKCLFVILGDPRRGPDGVLRISRLTGDEIVGRKPVPHLLFSSISRRRSEWHEEDFDFGGTHAPLVQQFKFLRLSPGINYEMAVLAIKGLQLVYEPGNFLTPMQYGKSPGQRRLFEQLLDWGSHPDPLSAEEIGDFLSAVEDGLLKERHGKPAHGHAYILFCLSHLRSVLDDFNLARRG